jgi:hypothetical protein
MRWPSDQAGLGGYQIDWTGSPDTPWINTPLWARGQPWALGGLGPRIEALRTRSGTRR